MNMLLLCGLVSSLLVGHLMLCSSAAPSVVNLVNKQERLQEIDNLTVRLNILLADFADLIAELGRLRRMAPPPTMKSSSSPSRRFVDKRNTFDTLAVGGRFG